jgi:hypothetical protein
VSHSHTTQATACDASAHHTHTTHTLYTHYTHTIFAVMKEVAGDMTMQLPSLLNRTSGPAQDVTKRQWGKAWGMLPPWAPNVLGLDEVSRDVQKPV